MKLGYDIQGRIKIEKNEKHSLLQVTIVLKKDKEPMLNKFIVYLQLKTFFFYVGQFMCQKLTSKTQKHQYSSDCKKMCGKN